MPQLDAETARLLIAALPLPVALIGPDRRFVAINPAAAALFGGGGEGRHYTVLVRAPPAIDCVEAAFSGAAGAEARFAQRQGAGETLWRARALPLDPRLGGGVALTFEDVTALEAAGQMRRDFVANVSHELKTPLTALLGFIETLKGPAKDDHAARGRFLAIMAGEAERMDRLVSDLLSLSRVESEERVRPATPVELRALLQSAAGAMRTLAAERGVAIEIAGEEGEVRVKGDADQLIQVVTNLIQNAVKYAASGKSVTLDLSTLARDPVLGAPAARIAVIDRGEGFDPIHIPRLTERFYRIDDHRSRAEGGTGLGLAIVKHIVGRHRGRLQIESAPGEGSRFTVILPMERA